MCWVASTDRYEEGIHMSIPNDADKNIGDNLRKADEQVGDNVDAAEADPTQTGGEGTGNSSAGDENR
jgi:hypothetical protein